MSFKVTRRKFLQTASIAAATLPLAKVVSAETGFVRDPFTPPGSFEGTQTVTGGVCEMCFWRCQLVGKVRDKKLVKLEGNPKSIDNGKSICARGNAGIKLLYDPDRLKFPLKNVGERGKPVWKQISWQEALDECGSKLKAVQEKYGSQGIAMFPHGASAKYPMDFFEKVVGTHNVSEASFFQCRGIRDSAYMATFGVAPGESVDMPNAKAILLIGCHFGENVHVSHVKAYLKGLENGAKLIVVDPRYSASAAKSDIWVQIKPGTDTAFLLAIMNYLVQKDKYDKKFVAAHCVGFEEFKKGISHASLDWAAKICDVPAKQIQEVADLLAANAPNVSIHPGRHVSWHGNDFQRIRAHACLTALLGAIGVKGGFVKAKGVKVKGISWPKVAEGGEEHNLKLMADKYHFAPPGTPTELIRDACITGKPYPIKGCVVWGQNPMQTIPNQQRMVDSLKQMDFVMCVDVMPTDITMYADILLPEACYLERYDYIKTGTQWNFADKHQQYIAPRMPLVDAMFERKDEVFITNEIAKRMGYGDKIPVNSLEEKINKELAGVNLSIAQLKKEDGIHIQDGKDPYGVSEDFEVQLYNEDLEDNDYPAVPTYIPVEEVPKGFTRLVYGRSPVHTFNRSQNNVWLHNAMPVNPVWLNDEIAKKMGLQEGDEVSLVNSEGVKSSSKTVVKVTPGIRKDTVYMAHGYGSRNPMLTVGVNAGVDDQELITKMTIDPETGCNGMRNNFVKLVKDGKTLDIPA
ncbi:MAG: molybdopterin-dependent oxidoreductase [Proteobacteria bacterium]|nr:molybdopterin-dependent oxidoreductase [Pseudomonadota bacterium]MBU4298266.1 molybdopterin-dependent oxidoreductase [Pseudomonadota bacterium]